MRVIAEELCPMIVTQFVNNGKWGKWASIEDSSTFQATYVRLMDLNRFGPAVRGIFFKGAFGGSWGSSPVPYLGLRASWTLCLSDSVMHASVRGWKSAVDPLPVQ